MSFDVLGRIITARVDSIRRVDWQDFRAGGFMFVFRPGTFDEAPHTFISAFQGPRDPDARARMQAALVSQFPNVTVIDLREILQTIQGIVNNVTLAVTVVGALVLLSGALILIGAVSMTKFRRVYEAAILKTLGASSRLIATMLVLEYGVLGAIAGTVGALGAIVLSWAVATLRAGAAMGADAAASPSPASSPPRCFVAAIGVLASLGRPAPQAARHPARGIAELTPGAAEPSSLADAMRAACGRRGPRSARPMDVETYRDALLRKRGELLGGTAAKPLQWTMENNSGRQGDMADQASGNNEVHIQLKLKQTDAKILQAIEEALRRIEDGHLRRLPRLRRADRRGAAERHSVDPRLHHLQGKAEGVDAATDASSDELQQLLTEFAAERLALLSATRRAPASSATTTSTTPTST